MTSPLTISTLLLLSAGTVQARYCYNNYGGYGTCPRRFASGGIAGVVIGALVLVSLCLLCTFLRRNRRMRFGSPSSQNGRAPAGRQVGFMYFPHPDERNGNHTTPHMAESGMGQHPGGMSMPAPQPAATDNLPSPPPAYHPQGKYQPPSGPPPTNGVSNGQAATHGQNFAPPPGPPPV